MLKDSNTYRRYIESKGKEERYCTSSTVTRKRREEKKNSSTSPAIEHSTYRTYNSSLIYIYRDRQDRRDHSSNWKYHNICMLSDE